MADRVALVTGYRKFAQDSGEDVGGVTTYTGDLWLEWQKAYRQLYPKLSQSQRAQFERLIVVDKEISRLSRIEEVARKQFRLSDPVDPVEMRQLYRNQADLSGSADARRRLDDLTQLHHLKKERNETLWDLERILGVSAYVARRQDDHDDVILQNNIPQIWAVIIGIDDYIHERRLHGAVKDARAVETYLTKALSVPSDHIVVLVNQDATRHCILDTLYSHLRDNLRIQRGDAIVIHFSGHGASYPAHGEGSVEAILPVDRGVCIADGDPILDISDRELNLFLSELGDAKGGNTTIILDCCFSGGGSRGGGVSNCARVATPLSVHFQDMLDAAESNPRKRWEHGMVSSRVWKPDMASHVILAACQDYELAQDCIDGGAFTIALLQQLRSVPLATTTYADLVRGIGMLSPRQQPLVAGKHKGSLVFQIGRLTDSL